MTARLCLTPISITSTQARPIAMNSIGKAELLLTWKIYGLKSRYINIDVFFQIFVQSHSTLAYIESCLCELFWCLNFNWILNIVANEVQWKFSWWSKNLLQDSELHLCFNVIAIAMIIGSQFSIQSSNTKKILLIHAKHDRLKIRKKI